MWWIRCNLKGSMWLILKQFQSKWLLLNIKRKRVASLICKSCCNNARFHWGSSMMVKGWGAPSLFRCVGWGNSEGATGTPFELWPTSVPQNCHRLRNESLTLAETCSRTLSWDQSQKEGQILSTVKERRERRWGVRDDRWFRGNSSGKDTSLCSSVLLAA